jgi:hypothetical protein
MAVQTIRSRFFELRAFLVFAALISLCVSNNVGPCFLPLPAVTDHVVEHRPHPQNNTVSRSSSRTGSDSFRVPIMGQAQKRADKEHHAQPFAASPKAGIVLPYDALTHPSSGGCEVSSLIASTTKLSWQPLHL